MHRRKYRGGALCSPLLGPSLDLLFQGGVSTTNLATKWTRTPLLADKIAKVANEILLRGQKRLVFGTQFFSMEDFTPPRPTVATPLNSFNRAYLVDF